MSHESISLNSAGDTINFSVVVDTFSTTVPGAITSAQISQLPVQISGFLAADSLVIRTDSLAEKCSPITSALITDVHNLLPRFPTLLSPASSWRDSTTLSGCQGSIPTKSRIVRSFKAVGMSTYENTPVLVVQRSDTVSAEGEGAEQQHHLLLNASGTGGAIYYLDGSTGRVVHLSVTQDLNLIVTTSGRTDHFRQNSRQEFALAR